MSLVLFEILSCLNPCFRGPGRLRNGEELGMFFGALWDYVRQVFTTPISQFDLLDLFFAAFVVFLVVLPFTRK
jgi:hypothetical protein